MEFVSLTKTLTDGYNKKTIVTGLDGEEDYYPNSMKIGVRQQAASPKRPSIDKMVRRMVRASIFKFRTKMIFVALMPDLFPLCVEARHSI